ncbi:Transposase [Phytophthora megakarya]|uniref:Transposase n=1 Tax=Phytophthora megakarya TaxID=4795 RepID=A0A225V577_9STRA|nr:Transposase [Phytophthora megakarya]
MTLHRFKQLQRCFSFNATPTTLPQDVAARILPLLNPLKITGGQYIHVGRDVALDEANVACRLSQGRHMIVYNPMKPTEKYHFRLYIVRSNVLDQLSGVMNQAEAQALREELDKVSKIKQHVLEVTRLLFGTIRVVRTDNHYTSVQFLQELRLKGLYGRVTVIAVSSHPGMLAASSCDGNVLNMVSNVDSTKSTTVKWKLDNEHREFPAPKCVANYNNNMHGVDRLDQIRGQFSMADGHSYKRWHKKLALALIDVASSNAYLRRRMVKLELTTRDPYKTFVIELIGELINGQ